MGYYDSHYRRARRRSNWLYPAVLGLVVGIFLFAVALPTLINNNLLPYDIVVKQQPDTGILQGFEEERATNPAVETQNLNVNVSTQITDIVGRVAPAVVGVVNIQSQGSFWQQQGSGEAGTGSGVIYKVDNGSAYVVTNHHVITGADEIEVVLSDDTHVTAELKGSDLFTDLAVLEMDASHVDKVVELGNSENVKVGEPAIAIGSPLGLHLSGSVTQGIVSGKQRAIPQDFDQDGRADWQAEVIQTDAAINPGNSGGALINISGQLIGINSMKIAQSAVEGIGFAIPIDDAIPIIKQLETEGKVTRPYLGVEAYSLEDVAQVEWERSLYLPKEVDSGIYLRSIEPMSPASSAGLEPYDVITHLDGNEIQNIIGLRKHLYQEKDVGDPMTITYYRNGERYETTVELVAQDY
ncbi:trypsin-like peptidase domain-containing protein [Aquibacillus koreensis]|uniref:Trypsin-like peptidase domain-containing protein n=1 Tax=Aquibacillus koreensis TaxID=279446 RepID=A0A9X3WJC4_9BACI|nr:trypsin-like peptidase domain-containing protein [Aquibacillus koreensis]MCT2537861.1 trypsin-like peptidase domain-containing protein [Aquibacillus koreensis]MDC3421107.1 trypsin-like peptidase domain-containing protein [Aquibacillus koreensis]